MGIYTLIFQGTLPTRLSDSGYHGSKKDQRAVGCNGVRVGYFGFEYFYVLLETYSSHPWLNQAIIKHYIEPC